MRLVCPNCGAQYEVDERVIPEAGRDVQCSNCGHTWFQHPEGYDGGAPEPAQAPVSEPPREEPETDNSDQTEDTFASSDAQDAIDAMIREEQADEPEKEPEPELTPEEGSEQQIQPDTAPAEDNTRTRRELDDGVRDVLREEAERETLARRSELDRIETQDELGLDENPSSQDQRGIAAQERMARLRGLDSEDDTTASGGDGARRDLLPDIEEINSSLAPIGSEEPEDDFAEPRERKGGFRRGFLIMILLVLVVIVLYVYAPVVSEQVPVLAPYLETFTSQMDQARAWLDSMVKLALEKMQEAGA